jgi:hypothetical protein
MLPSNAPIKKIFSLKDPISFRDETCRHNLCIACNFINFLQTDDDKVKKVKGLLSLLGLKSVTSLVLRADSKSPLLIGALDGSIQSLTIPDTINIQIVLLKMSTAMLDSC